MSRRARSAWVAIVAALLVAPSAPAAFDLTATDRPGLAVGVTEPNPAFLWPTADRPLPPPFARWRDEVDLIRPRLHRLVLEWPALQPVPDRPADLDRADPGCARGVGPCLGWAGVREQLRAIAARQRAGGLEVLVVITGTPAWAASPPSGCERPGDGSRARAPTAAALPDYARLVRDVLAAARQAGAELRWWSAWNEPNHPFFLSPQRAACDRGSPTLSPAAYATLFRALGAVLADEPGDQRPVVGELAGAIEGSAVATSIAEFIAALPRDVVCGASVWTQHAYVARRDPAPIATRALDARGCERRHAVWMTETGLGVARLGTPPPGPLPHDRPDACERLHAWLLRWWVDPRVTAAFQYTVREDPVFAVGLLAADLERAHATRPVWQGWGHVWRADPASPPPTEELVCGARAEGVWRQPPRGTAGTREPRRNAFSTLSRSTRRAASAPMRSWSLGANTRST